MLKIPLKLLIPTYVFCLPFSLAIERVTRVNIRLPVDDSTIKYVHDNGTFDIKGVPGYVLFRVNKKTSIAEFLLLKLKIDGGFWWTNSKSDEPVGSEEAENIALKTLEKQTGVQLKDIKIIPDFVEFLDYMFLNHTRRAAVYYMAQLLNPKQKIILSKQHEGSKWLEIKEAFQIARYPDDYDALLAADKYFKITTPSYLPSYLPTTTPESIELV